MNPIWALLRRDVLLEKRTHHALQAGIVMVGILDLFMLLAIDRIEAGSSLHQLVLWIPLLLGVLVTAGHWASHEVQEGTLVHLRMSAIGPATIGLLRTAVDMVPALLVAVLHQFLLNLLWGLPWSTLPAVLLALVGLSLLAGLLGGLTAYAQSRDMLLPVLFLPLTLPLWLPALQLVEDANPSAWYLLLGYDLLALAMAVLLWPQLLEVDA